MMDTVADPHWHAPAEEALVCRSTGWFQRKFEQYDRERGYRNDACGLVYVVDGRGAWADAGRSGELQAGDLLCLPPDVWAWHDPDPDLGWEECWCCFTGSAWDRIAGDLFAATPQAHHLGVDPPLIAAFARLRRTMHQQQSAWWLEAAAVLHRILARSRVLKTRPTAPPGLTRACQELLDLLTEASDQAEVDIHAFARSRGVHYDSLRRQFRKSTGTSPKRYHTAIRLRGAAELLLLRPELPVAEVARTYGWDDPAWFSRHFSRWKGCSPTVWRGTGTPAAEWNHTS